MLFLSKSLLFAQADTCDCQKNKPTVIPLVLIGLGSINFLDKTLDNKIQSWRTERFPTFRTHVDDYILYAPLASAYAFQAFSIKGKHNVKHMTAISTLSLLGVTGVVHGLKNTVRRERPDLSSNVSFPSGHTASAFWAATIFHKEYSKKYPWISVMSYGIATTTGALRVMNNRHWFSDICVGAGIGILTTELVYRAYDKQLEKRRKRQSKPLLKPLL